MRVSLAADLAAWRDATAAVLAHAPSGLDAAEAAALHRELRATCDRVLAYAGRLLAAVEADGRWATGGTRTFPEWVARQRGSSVGAARSEVALGRALEADLPVAAAAVEAGEITLEHAQVLARLGPTSEARRAALASDLPDRNEAALVEQAKRMDADRFRRVVKRWAGSVDAAQHEREHADAVARERLVLSRRDGGVAFEGFLTVEHADVLQTALRAVVGVPAATDRRTTEQRMAGPSTTSLASCSTAGWRARGARPCGPTSACTSAGRPSAGWRSGRVPARVPVGWCPRPSSTTASRSPRPCSRASRATAR